MTPEYIAYMAVILVVGAVMVFALYMARQSAAASREIDRLDAEIASRKAARTADHSA